MADDDVAVSHREMNTSLCRKSIHAGRPVDREETDGPTRISYDTNATESTMYSRRDETLTISQLPSVYSQLSKAKLTGNLDLSCIFTFK